MIDATAVIYVLVAIILFQLSLIFGLANRIVKQAGLRPISGRSSVGDLLHEKQSTAKVEHPRVQGGSARVHI